MKTNDPLIVWDIDNTLLTNWKGWDMAIQSLGKVLTGREFSPMTMRLDGSVDTEFSKKSPWQLVRERLSELGIANDSMNEQEFYHRLDVEGCQVSYRDVVQPFADVDEFVVKIQKLSRRRMPIVSSGPRNMQVRVLEAAGLLHRFDIAASSFGGEFGSKGQALGRLAEEAKTDALVYFGDAPGDMTAVLSAPCQVSKRCAVGVTLAGLTTSQELRSAGAHLVVERFDQVATDSLKALIFA